MKHLSLFILFGVYVRITSGFYAGCTGRLVQELVPNTVYTVQTQCVKENDIYTFFATFDTEQFTVLNQVTGVQ